MLVRPATSRSSLYSSPTGEMFVSCPSTAVSLSINSRSPIWKSLTEGLVIGSKYTLPESLVPLTLKDRSAPLELPSFAASIVNRSLSE